MTPDELASVTGVPAMLEIHAQWDDEAHVWVATSEDVPRLITEAPSMSALVERLKAIIPDLMELNLGITFSDVHAIRLE